MKITKALKMALKSVLELSLGEVKTDKAVLVWDGEDDLKEGMEVFVRDENDEFIPAEDGEYTSEDGKVITVAEGKVAGIKDPEAEVAPELSEDAAKPEADPIDEPKTEEPKADDRIAELEGRMTEIVEGLTKILNGMTALEERIAALEEKVAKVEAEPAADPIEEPKSEDNPQMKSKLSYLRKK